MKNPFVLTITVPTYRASAVVKKRKGSFVDTEQSFHVAATEKDAAKGLRNMCILRGASIISHAKTELLTTYVKIPFWSLAFWFPKRRPAYMKKRGYGPK